MTASTTQSNLRSRLAALTGFLEQDPDNLNLLADAAGAALEESEPARAAELLARYAAIAPLPPALRNLQGLAAMGEGRHGEAADIFTGLLADAPADAALRFNLAWSKAMLGDHAGAEALIDETVVASVPRAAALKIQSLHHLARLEDALACGLGFAELRPDDADLMGALALVALDAEETDLARSYAARAGDANPDGLSTLGTLELNAHRLDAAAAYLDRALALHPDHPRALLGKGLVQMAQGDATAAVATLGAGAAGFGNHLGSWIAAGWASFVAGDQAAARATFEKALALDDTFAESHGSLAVMDVLDGDLESAQRRTEVALRLDRQCFSAALAKSLLLAAKGDAQSAQRVRDIALNTPIGANGMTIAQAMASLGPAAKR